VTRLPTFKGQGRGKKKGLKVRKGNGVLPLRKEGTAKRGQEKKGNLSKEEGRPRFRGKKKKDAKKKRKGRRPFLEGEKRRISRGHCGEAGG